MSFLPSVPWQRVSVGRPVSRRIWPLPPECYSETRIDVFLILADFIVLMCNLRSVNVFLNEYMDIDYGYGYGTCVVAFGADHA